MGGRKSKTLINVWSLCSVLYTRLADVGYGTKSGKELMYNRLCTTFRGYTLYPIL